MTSQRPQDWRYILEDSGAKCLFVATKKLYHETFHFAGVHANVQSVFCFEQPSGRPGSFQDLLQANVGECCQRTFRTPYTKNTTAVWHAICRTEYFRLMSALLPSL